MLFHLARRLAEPLRRPTIYPNIPPSNECFCFLNHSIRKYPPTHHLSINSIFHNQPNLPQYPSSILEMAPRKKLKKPKIDFAFTRNTLRDLRASLTPAQLSRLPSLPQLTFYTLDPSPPHPSQVALLIGHFECPNEDPIRLGTRPGAPVYAFMDQTVRKQAVANPRAYLDFLGDGPSWPSHFFDADEFEERKDPKKRAELKGKYPGDFCTQFQSWWWPARNGMEFEAQVLLCHLLAAEAKVIPKLESRKGLARHNLLEVLREIYDREPGSEYPMDWGTLQEPIINFGLYVVPGWRAGERLTEQQYKLRRDWSDIFSRSIAKQSSELKAMEQSHRFIETLPDADASKELGALGLDLQPFRGTKRNIDALDKMIEEKRVKVQKLTADKDRIDGQLSPWMLPEPLKVAPVGSAYLKRRTWPDVEQEAPSRLRLRAESRRQEAE
jgi:hypothetical protein